MSRVPMGVRQYTIQSQNSIKVPESTIRHYMSLGESNRNNCIRMALNYYNERGYFIDDLEGKLSVLTNYKNTYKSKISYYEDQLKSVNQEIKNLRERLGR